MPEESKNEDDVITICFPNSEILSDYYQNLIIEKSISSKFLSKLMLFDSDRTNCLAKTYLMKISTVNERYSMLQPMEITYQAVVSSSDLPDLTL